jgi:hypothetical protein
MTEIMSQGEKVANSVALVLVARVAMILAAAALPAAGWMLQRSVAAVDRVSDKVDGLRDDIKDNAAAIRLIQQTQQVQSSFIADHETRVRILESRVPKL